MDRDVRRVAVVGAGLIGSGWAIVFARAGLSVAVYDEQPNIRQQVASLISQSLRDMHGFGLVNDVAEVMQHIRVVNSIEEAVGDADYIQESVFERIDIKREVSIAIATAMRPGAIVGSSSSGIPASAFTQDVPHRERFIVAHPVNPPHLIPVVELVRAPWTDHEVPAIVRGLMEDVGQAPIFVEREVEGFVLNRLQGALLNEAWALFAEGVASAADIDRTVSQGLGLRWSFMGPFETIDLNAPGGVSDYASRLGPLYHSIALDRRNPQPWTTELAERVAAQLRQTLPLAELAHRRAWRDRRLMALGAHKASVD